MIYIPFSPRNPALEWAHWSLFWRRDTETSRQGEKTAKKHSIVRTRECLSLSKGREGMACITKLKGLFPVCYLLWYALNRRSGRLSSIPSTLYFGFIAHHPDDERVASESLTMCTCIPLATPSRNRGGLQKQKYLRKPPKGFELQLCLPV